MTKEINTSSLFQSILEAQKNNELPPVEKWNPPLCENVDMKIARDGKWYFKNSPIGREKMVKLFSTVIRYDDDGFYYLVTPVEKIQLQVEDKPFVIKTFNKEIIDGKEVFLFQTNVDDIVTLSNENPLRVEINKDTQEPSPYVLVRKNLKGVVSEELATKWSSNKDATEWTFNLRKGVKFHDGSDFDAEDVKYSLMRVKDPEIGSPAKKKLKRCN